MRIHKVSYTVKLDNKKISIFFICLYIFTSSLFPVWLEITILLIAVLSLVLASHPTKTGMTKRYTKLQFIYLITFIFVILNNANIIHMEYRNIVEYSVAFLLFTYLRERESWAYSFISILAMFGMLHAVITIFLYFSPDFYLKRIVTLFSYAQQIELIGQFNNGWAAGIAPHYSMNGIYLSLGLGAVLVKIFEKRRSGTFVSYLQVFTILIALLMTGKRAHTLFGVVACIAVVFFQLNRKEVFFNIKIILSLLCISLGAYILSQYIPALSNVISRFISTSQSGNLTMGRTTLWKIAFTLWRQHPLFGIGWDAFKYYYLVTSPQHILLNVHNVYIQLLCETGIIGAMTFYAFFTIALLHCINVVRFFSSSIEKIPDSEKTTALFALYIQAFFLMYCLTGNPLYDAPMLFPYILACANTEYNYYHYCILPKQDISFGGQPRCV